VEDDVADGEDVTSRVTPDAVEPLVTGGVAITSQTTGGAAQAVPMPSCAVVSHQDWTGARQPPAVRWQTRTVRFPPHTDEPSGEQESELGPRLPEDQSSFNVHPAKSDASATRATAWRECMEPPGRACAAGAPTP